MAKTKTAKKKETKKRAKLMERHNYFETPDMMKLVRKQYGVHGQFATLSQFLRAAVRAFLKTD